MLLLTSSTTLSSLLKNRFGWRLYYLKAYWAMRHVRKINTLISAQEFQKLDKYFQKISHKQKIFVFKSHYDIVAMLQNEVILSVLLKHGYDINEPILDFRQEGQHIKEHAINILALKETQSSGGFDITPKERQIYISNIFKFYQRDTQQLSTFKSQLQNSKLDIDYDHITAIDSWIEKERFRNAVPAVEAVAPPLNGNKPQTKKLQKI